MFSTTETITRGPHAARPKASPRPARSSERVLDGDRSRFDGRAPKGSSMVASRYSLSFTVGGLFLFEGIEIARMRASGMSWDDIRRTVPRGLFVAKGGTASANRMRNEVAGRLATLAPDEIAFLAEAGITDARALMWVAACRRYRILGEFAFEVLDERLRTHQTEVRASDFGAHLDAKAVVADEIGRLAPSTRQRLRSAAMRMLREAEIVDDGNHVRRLPISSALADLLSRDRPNGIDIIPGGR